MKNDMNVLLIMPPSPNVNMTIGFDVHTMPPLGIGYIATYLENSGYSCKIIDMNIPEITIYDVINEVRKRKYRLVGISTTTECYNTSVRIANIVKCEDVDYVMMGGAHATFEYETILQNDIIDFVVRSEGEITTKKLCDYIYLGKGDLADIDGLSYRKDTDIVTNKNVEFICNLDELPFPNRELYDLEKYPHKGNISTSRGCPGKCIFCAASALAGGKYRMRSAASIMEEVLYLYGLGIRHIDFVDDTMTASVKRLNEFLDLLLKHQLPITWYCESRVDSMNYELLKKMKKAGLTSIQFGVESGNQEMLDCLKKNISLGQVEDVFRWCYELDITVTTNMIIGQPYDTEESIDDTMKLAKKLIECNAHVSYTICTPYPGTYLWNNSKELGIEIVETDYDKYSTFYPVINTKNFTAQQLRNLYYKAVMEVARNNMRKNQETRTGSSIRRDESIMLANEKAQERLSKYKIGGLNMSKRQDMHFKECLPENTVNIIKSTLKALGIDIQEQWVDKSKVDTYSLRVSVAGTKIGANGKGLSKEYAMASAYAEFMERFQNNLLNKYPKTEINQEGFYYSYDENMLTAKQLILENNAFVKHLFCRRNIEQNDIVEKEKVLMKLHEAEYLLTKKEEFVCIPFYSVNEERIINMPYNIYINMYGSNGMCAGNTEREAIIQGLSEIVERYIQKKLFLNNYALPDIPENYIKKYPEIYKRYEKLKQIEGYDFYLKDCSLGGRYPVAALYIVEKNTGRFGVKLGCHPDFGTAMERTITEATQGCEITEYCDRSKLDFLNMGVSNEININNSYKTGYAKYPYQIFNVDADFEFKEVKDVSNLSDEEILNYFISDVIGEEYEILVRNVSYSQLKSFHIIIPGMSEMSSGDDEGFVLISRSRIAEYLINNPQDIDENGCNILLYVLLMVSKMQLTCSLSNLSGTLLHEEYLPGEEYHLGWLFMIVMCYVYKGDYMKAYEKMKLFVEICEGADYTVKAYYKAIAYYLQAVVANVGNHHQIIQYMKVFFDTDVVKNLEKNFEDNKLIFVRHYIMHDTNTCQSKGCCDYHIFEELQEKHWQLMKNSNIGSLSNSVKEGV